MTSISPHNADAVIQELGSAIVNDAVYTAQDWQALAVVFSEPGEGCQALNGFWYDATLAPHSRLPQQRDGIIDLFISLQGAVEAQFGKRLKAALFTIRREGLQMALDLDFADAQRWAVSPADYAVKPLEFLQD